MINIIKSAFNIIKTLASALLLLFLVTFMVVNRQLVTVSFFPLPFEVETRTFLVIIFFFLLGMLCGFLAFSRNMIGKSLSNFKDKMKIKKLEKVNRNKTVE
jgi:uncharacterized integral membrane protein